MKLETTKFTQALIDLEDAEPDVLFETLPGTLVPLWPRVRMHIAYAMSATEFTSVAVAGSASRASAFARVARSMVPSRRDAAALREPRDIVFLVGGTTVARTSAGEKNWLVGDFAEQFPGDSAILQWCPIEARSGGPAFSTTSTLDPLVMRSAVATRLRPPPSHDAEIRRLVAEFGRRLGSDISDKGLEAIVADASYEVRLSVALNRRLDEILDRLRPHTILFEDAVDGQWGETIAGIKSRGIHVAEPQHGWIGPGHAAYNFGSAMHRPELKAAIPDELLTFGRFWSESVGYVGAVTTIGKPQFESAVESAPPAHDRPLETLVVSSVGEPERTSEFVVALADALPTGWSVRFRVHPSERASQSDRYPRLVADCRITMDERTDVYESLGAARIVVGVASTVLFEAAGMGCQVFVRDTPYVPYIVGDLFGDPLDAVNGVRRVAAAAEAGGLVDATAVRGRAELWQTNSLQNYRDWILARSSHVSDSLS